MSGRPIYAPELMASGMTASSLRAGIGNAKARAAKGQVAILMGERDSFVLGYRSVHGLDIVVDKRLKPGQFALLTKRPRGDEVVALTAKDLA